MAVAPPSPPEGAPGAAPGREPLIVAWAEVGPFRQNSYVVGDPATREAILVDPGDEPARIEALLAQHGLRPKAILNTHAHLDHVGAVLYFQERHGLPFHLHRGDEGWLTSLPLQAQMFGVPASPVPQVDHWLEEGGAFEVGERRLQVIHTPGHTPGGVCFHFSDDGVLITGDTLFAGSVGRTDFPGGSWEQLEHSIRQKLFPLGDEVKFYAGHGPPSTLGEERRSNPFVGETRGDRKSVV